MKVFDRVTVFLQEHFLNATVTPPQSFVKKKLKIQWNGWNLMYQDFFGNLFNFR